LVLLIFSYTYTLTDTGITEHSIPYLIFDQCMLRSEQTKISSYHLEFYLEALHICQPEG
jgi:hypothetical protein